MAAYMVGLNHEFARELRWREYPTDQRGTYFASFWGHGTDLPALHTWKQDLPLGGHLTARDRVVLLLRSALLRRYPGAIIYAAPLVSTEPVETGARHPIFRGGLDPDTAMVGFDITEAELRDGDWCFVIAEQPTEPRFGVDDPPTKALADPPAPESWGRQYEPPPDTPSRADDWNNLNWTHLFDSKDAYLQATHAPGTVRPRVSIPNSQPPNPCGARAPPEPPASASSSPSASYCRPTGCWPPEERTPMNDLGALRQAVAEAEEHRALLNTGATDDERRLARSRLGDARRTVDEEVRTLAAEGFAPLLGRLDPEVPLALLPVRLETRLRPDEQGTDRLLVRLFPDDIHIEQHEQRPTEGRSNRPAATGGPCGGQAAPRTPTGTGNGC
ncbi:hypothetical protein ACFQ0G_38215 [Streptomyces chiangmaiensis]